MSISVFDLLALTCNSLRGNPLRSALTTLGVFMGVAAVSATLQVGSISRAVIAQKLAERDAPMVGIYPQWQPGKPFPQMRSEDMEFLRRRLQGVQAISAMDWAGSARTVFQDKEANPFMMGVTQDFLLTSGRQLIAGRFFTAADFESFRPVTVIDQFLANQLFEGQEAVGERIYANGRPYVVVGVLPTKLDGDEEEPQGQMLIPMSLHSAMTGSRDIGYLQLRPYNIQNLEALGQRAEQLLQQRSPERKFWIQNNVKDILEQQKTLELASRALAAVGVISLLVGGVGIANITIASVMERTSEIGLRRAIGATQRDIMLQFILEAALLSLLGGVSAIASVHGLTVVVANTFNLPYQFESNTAALSLGAALLVGVGAGFVPALRASQLDPVKALRSA